MRAFLQVQNRFYYTLCKIRNLCFHRRLSTAVPMKIFTQKPNRFTGACEWDVQADDYDYHQEIARAAFADMLHDTERNKKYYVALKHAINKMHSRGKKANVLDIGTGTGLLSIMAAQCGADSIVACESFGPMADCALEILKKNKVADKIKVIPKISTDIIVGEDGDMKEKANILVTEVFDTELIGEGALFTFKHAHSCLLEQDCIVVPDSAVIYAQVVECPTLQKCNKINDLVDEELKVILRTPEKIKSCAGSHALHDLQLSQLPPHSFRALSQPIPVLQYDWTGREPLELARNVRTQLTVRDTGTAQLVFMWWELKMDTEGTSLSCAPWWHHPDTDKKAASPQDSVPWRDHWMQAIYYLPRQINVQKGQEVTLVSCQDEYSLWFFVEDGNSECYNIERPACRCGAHVSLSRTHICYLNDGTRTKKFLAEMKETMNEKSIVLNLNGGSLLGLAAAAMGVERVFYIEHSKFILDTLEHYTKENELKNVTFFPDIMESVLGDVTHIIGDPNFTNSILPWDNLRLAYILYKYRAKLRSDVQIVPSTCTLWAVPVQFFNLHKIRIPLGTCEGIDMSTFDNLIEKSRRVSDEKLEPQPLWEYPCVCRGTARPIFHIDLHNLLSAYSEQKSVSLSTSTDAEGAEVNGVVVWASWGVGSSSLSSGALVEPRAGEQIQWAMHTRQAVYLMEKPRAMRPLDKWGYKVDCDLDNGTFNVEIHIDDHQ